jgi:type VII secretion-associated serine protease mycosin
VTTRIFGRRVAALIVVSAATATPLAVGAPDAAADTTRTAQWPIAFLNLPQAWKMSKGAGVTVAVLDSGVVGTRADLTGQVTTGKDFAGGTAVPGDPQWGAHGTGMASVIAGHGHGPGNSSGIMGVAPAAKILSVRVIRDDESPDRGLQETSLQPISQGIRYAVDNGAKVISMSLGGTVPGSDTDDTAEADAVRYALAHGVSVVVAAGNSGDDPLTDVTEYPAGERGVIGVAAVDSNGKRASFSSTGWDVAVAAPGVDIPMALPIDDPNNVNYADFGTVIDSSTLIGAGTSPACAYVAGVVALVRSAYPNLSPAQISQLLKDTASHRPAGGRNDQIGSGIVDPVAALKAAANLTPESSDPLTAPANAGPGHFGFGPAIDASEPGAPLSNSTRGAANAGIALAGAAWIGGWLLIRGRRRSQLAASGQRQGQGPGPDPVLEGWLRPVSPMQTPAPPVAPQTPAPSVVFTPMPPPHAVAEAGQATEIVPATRVTAPEAEVGADTSAMIDLEATTSDAEAASVTLLETSTSTSASTPVPTESEAAAALPAESEAESEAPAEPDKVDTMNQFAGKSIAPSPFPTDDGSADPELIAVLEAHGRGHTELERAYGTLLNARVLAPIVAVLGEAEDIQIADGRSLKSDKNSDMALVTLVAPDGTRALPVFTSVAALAAWNADARPMPVAFPRACSAAKAENAEIVLVDLGQPSFLEVEPAAVRAFAAMVEQQEQQKKQGDANA